MPEAVEVHRRWHHMRVDDEGITIGWWHRRERIPWSQVGALVVDVPVSLLEIATRLSLFSQSVRRPCLYVCMLRDSRPHPALAVRFRLRGFHRGRDSEREAAQVRSLLSGWIDLHEVACHFSDDVAVWWYAQPGARPAKETFRQTSEPTVTERAARLHQEVELMRTEHDHLRDEH